MERKIINQLKMGMTMRNVVMMIGNAGAIIIICFVSCGLKEDKPNTYDSLRTQKIEYKDSAFIMYTLKEWDLKNWWVFHNDSILYHSSNSKIEYFFSGVFYSPDKKRIVVWFGRKLPNATARHTINKDEP